MVDFTPDLNWLVVGVGGSVLEVERITEEAGELPGVSAAVVPEIDLSIESTLEMESRNWESGLPFNSSRALSIARMLAVRFCALADMSLCSRRISPLTVRRSLRPFRIIARTRSIAGP